jgi:hypothetical protein
MRVTGAMMGGREVVALLAEDGRAERSYHAHVGVGN